MGIGTMGTFGSNLECQPQGSLLTEADGVGTRWLTVKTTVTVNFRMVLVKIACPPRAKGLLVRNAGKSEAAVQFLPITVQITKRKYRSRGSTLHV